MRDVFGVAHQLQHLRTDEHAGQQVTEHGTELKALGQGDDDDGGHQENDRGLQQAAFVWHGSIPFLQ